MCLSDKSKFLLCPKENKKHELLKDYFSDSKLFTCTLLAVSFRYCHVQHRVAFF
jgi:hypothetical protein